MPYGCALFWLPVHKQTGTKHGANNKQHNVKNFIYNFVWSVTKCAYISAMNNNNTNNTMETTPTTTNVYTLTKIVAKPGKFNYIVTDQNGQVISTRTSARHYVACTADGSFYFGRLDLIGKGDHGKFIKDRINGLQITREVYAAREWTMSYEAYIEDYKNDLERFNQIAYLNQ